MENPINGNYKIQEDYFLNAVRITMKNGTTIRVPDHNSEAVKAIKQRREQLLKECEQTGKKQTANYLKSKIKEHAKNKSRKSR